MTWGAISVPEGIHGPLQLLLFAPPHSGLGVKRSSCSPLLLLRHQSGGGDGHGPQGADQFQVPLQQLHHALEDHPGDIGGGGGPLWRWMVLNSGLRRDTCTVVHLS